MADDFHRTVMGHRFYEGTMPELVAQLKRLNDNLEKMIVLSTEVDKEPVVTLNRGNTTPQ
jgi:hypothetical protein